MNKTFRKIFLALVGAAVLFVTVYAVEIGGVTYTGFGPIAPESIYVLSGDQGDGSITLTNAEKIANGTDAVVQLDYNDDAVELGDFQIRSTNAATADNDFEQITFWAKDDDDLRTLRELGQIVVTATDLTSNTLDSSLKLNLLTGSNASAPTTAATLTGTALTLPTGSSIVAPGGATIGGGTAITKPLFGTLVFPDASTTTASIACSGLTAASRIVAVPNTAYSGSVYLKSVVPGTDAAVVTFSGDPGTTVTLAFWSVR